MQWPNEARLLLLAARPHLDVQAVEQLKTLCASALNWDYILQLAQRHGLAPMLYWNFRAVDGLNKRMLSQLEKSFQYSGERNLFQLGELLKILRTFKGKDILAIPFKGPVLARTLYPHLALRPFGDLDLLVNKEDMPRALKLLAEAGYRPWVEKIEEQRFRERFFNHHALTNTKTETVVELHWDLMPPYFAPPSIWEAVWQQTETISIGSERVYVLRPEALLLFLCQHGACHAWGSLLGICDVAALIHVTPSLEWDLLIQQARTAGTDRMLLVGLLLAKELLHAELPPQVLRCVEANHTLTAISSKLRHQLFHEVARTNGLPAKLSRARFQLQMQQRAKDKVRYCFYKAVMSLR